ncbi:MAG: glycine cleavage system aminomethyltransferase GcvT [Geobacteraceae bacterium]|nr:glycine cleavage system aminomethyltransferase GcvT [Geobacteraceae bacterium]
MEELKKTPLFQEHERLGAQMAPFGGWMMPIQYGGILAEHRWCRESAALFDTSHMGEILFRGKFMDSGIESLFTFRVGTIAAGRCRYGFLLNDKGGVVDDLTVYRLTENGVMIVVNAGPADKDFSVIRAALAGRGVLENATVRTGKLDLQGPRSREVLAALAGREIGEIPFFGFRRLDMLGAEALVSRTGYTGELGYEIYLEADRLPKLWQRLLEDDRVRPAGLGARDLLRLEMGYSLYGSDLDESTTPLEAGLDRFVDFSREFTGREALLSQRDRGPDRLKAAFRISSRRTPRHGYRIFHQGESAGEVTSGAFSPMLGCGIGLGYVKPFAAACGTVLEIRHESVVMEATVVELPFYKGGSLRV